MAKQFIKDHEGELFTVPGSPKLFHFQSDNGSVFVQSGDRVVGLVYMPECTEDEISVLGEVMGVEVVAKFKLNQIEFLEGVCHA